jgi:hypothetical protein
MPARLHVWRMFIKPRELLSALQVSGFDSVEFMGLAPRGNPLRLLYDLYLLKKGRLALRAMAERIRLHESRDRSILYAGVARKCRTFTDSK